MAGVIGMAACAVQAQQLAVTPHVTLEPSISVRQTITDNVRLSSTNRRSELITEITPQLRLRSSSGVLRGSVDFALSALFYARESESNRIQFQNQNGLTAAGTVEVIDQWAYIDASASVSQQLVSALGTQSSDSALINSNTTQVATFQVSPYVRGRLGGFADYEARLTWAATTSDKSNADSSSPTASLRIGAVASAGTRFGWSADLSHQSVDFNGTGRRDSDRLNLTLSFAVTPQLRLSALGGRESNNYLTLGRKSYDTWGWRASWAPTERTVLEGTAEHRFFGNSHSVRFQHRMPRSVWTFSDSQDLSTNAFTGGATGPSTVYSLLYEQFASIAPDPVQRAALVDAFLQNFGLTRTSLVSGGFLTSAASIQRSQNASAALLGVRSTVLLSIFRNDARPLDQAAVGIGDLSNGNTLHQRGVSVNVSHRLTPASALSVDYRQTRARASLGSQSTDLKTLVATWTNQLSDRADLSISARRAQFDSATNPYTENAVVANLTLRF